jgi:hypothetical protein
MLGPVDRTLGSVSLGLLCTVAVGLVVTYRQSSDKGRPKRKPAEHVIEPAAYGFRSVELVLPTQGNGHSSVSSADVLICEGVGKGGGQTWGGWRLG